MNNILKEFPFHLNHEQQLALSELIEFINSSTPVFILRGFAGTGKTSLVLGMIKHLRGARRNTVLLASTGRAAKVLSDKTASQTSTLHRHIYALDVLKTGDTGEVYKLIFKLKTNNDSADTIYFVDESSMLGDNQKEGGFVEYGSGRVLTDFFKFLNGRKVVFIGDPCQLPPVNTSFSPALHPEALQKRFGIGTSDVLLEQVMRFPCDSGIYANASRIRSDISSGCFPALFINSHFADISVLPGQTSLVEAYTASMKPGDHNGAVFITHTNKAAGTVNRMVRQELGFDIARPVPQDALMVVKNNYAYSLFNGEQLIVKSVSEKTEIRTKLNIRFRRAILLKGIDPFYVEIDCFIIDDLLNSDSPDLAYEQEKELYIDFAIRMNKAGIKPNSLEFVMRQMKDEYLNAIRVKYGYAVTCHKAQGGEWPHVFVLMEYSLDRMDPETRARWLYTALTRSSKHLYFSKSIYIR